MSLERVVFLPNDDAAQTLFSTGSFSQGGQTVNYSDNDIYVTPSSDMLQQYPSFNDFPAIGKEGLLYLVSDNGALYYWRPASGYIQLFVPQIQFYDTIDSWNAGTMTSAFIINNAPTLRIINGIAPILGHSTKQVITSLTTRGEG